MYSETTKAHPRTMWDIINYQRPLYHAVRTPCSMGRDAFPHGLRCYGGIERALKLMRVEVSKCLEGELPCVRHTENSEAQKTSAFGNEECETLHGEGEHAAERAMHFGETDMSDPAYQERAMRDGVDPMDAPQNVVDAECRKHTTSKECNLFTRKGCFWTYSSDPKFRGCRINDQFQADKTSVDSGARELSDDAFSAAHAPGSAGHLPHHVSLRGFV